MQQVGMNGVQNTQMYKKDQTSFQGNYMTPPPQMKEDGDKKLVGALTALGAIGAAGVGIAALAKGKVKDLPVGKGAKEFVESLTEDGKKFTGILRGKTKAGKAFNIVYKDGVMQSSQCGKTFKKFIRDTKDKLVSVQTNGSRIDIEALKKNGIQKADSVRAYNEYAKQQEQRLIAKGNAFAESITGPKSHKSAQESAEAMEEAFKNQEFFGVADKTAGKSAKESAEAFQEMLDSNDEIFKYADMSTGKSAKESAEFINSQLNAQEVARGNELLDTVTGKKSNKSAKRSAEVFEQAFGANDEIFSYADRTAGKSAKKSAEIFARNMKYSGNIRQRMAELGIKDNRKNKQISNAIQALGSDRIKRFTDDEIIAMFNSSNPKNVVEKLDNLKKTSDHYFNLIMSSNVGRSQTMKYIAE